MNKNITCVVVNGRNIEVKNGRVLVFTGHGPYDAAFYKKLEDCSDADFNAAKEAEVTTENFNPTPWGDSLDKEEVQNQNCENKSFDQSEYKVDNSDFNKAVDFLTHCSGEDFVMLVHYAKTHHNTFWHCVKELADVVNADDCYCSAIISLTRHFGEELENLAFQKLNLLEDGHDEEFIEFFNALKVINS